MGTAIRIENSTDVEIRGTRISGFRKGIEIINSDVTVRNAKIGKCNLGVDIHNSEVVMQDNVLLDNVIDMAIQNSKVSLINTLADKIIISVQNLDIQGREDIINLATKTKNAKSATGKKTYFRKLLEYLKLLKDIAAIYVLLKDILRLAGISF